MTKHILPIGTALLSLSLLAACGGSPAPASTTSSETGTATEAPAAGKAKMVTAADLNLGDIDQAMVEKGKTSYDVKCQACHSTGPNRVVGPGWKGITTRRTPEWIMNMILNTEAMLDADPEAQRQLEECLVRMPNQNLNQTEAREVLEFMRTL